MAWTSRSSEWACTRSAASAGVTGIEMGAIAIRHALADAGVEWRDIQFAFGGQLRGRQPRRGRRAARPHRHPVHRRLQRLRDRGERARRSPPTRSASATHDLGIAVGMDKHLPGAFSADPRLYACPSWYGEVGQFLTTKFFGMKINKYMHDHGISHETLAKVAAKNYRNGALNPNAFRRKPLSEEEILGVADAQLPAHAVHVLQPRRRRRRGRAVQGRARAPLHRHADLPARRRRCAPAGSARSRCTARGSRSRRPPGPTVDASRAAYEMAGIGPEDVDVIQLQDTDAGAEVIHLAENGFCADGEQEAARRRRRARDRRPAAGQHRRRAHRQRRADRRVGPAPGARGRAAAARAGRRPAGARATRRSATPSSTARPAPPASRSSRSEAG